DDRPKWATDSGFPPPPPRPDNRVMAKRRLLLLLAVVVLAGVASLLVLSPRPLSPPLPIQPSVSPDNFRRLHQGMSTAEVKAILGEPEERYHKSDTADWVWMGEGCRIEITFCVDAFWGELATDDGQVLHLPPSHPPPTF